MDFPLSLSARIIDHLLSTVRARANQKQSLDVDRGPSRIVGGDRHSRREAIVIVRAGCEQF